MTSRKVIQHLNLCLEARGQVVLLQYCSYDRSQQWFHTKEGLLQHISTAKCLGSSHSEKELSLETCDARNHHQLWRFVT